MSSWVEPCSTKQWKLELSEKFSDYYIQTPAAALSCCKKDQGLKILSRNKNLISIKGYNSVKISKIWKVAIPT